MKNLIKIMKNFVFRLISFPGKFADYLHSDKVDDGLYKLSQFHSFRRSSTLLVIITVAFFSIIIWGSFAQINQVVRGSGEVIPSSKIQLLQSGFDGVVESINAELGQRVNKGDILFGIDYEQAKEDYEITLSEVEARQRKVEILENLVLTGSEAEVRLLDERLALGDAKKRFNSFKKRFDLSLVRAPVDGIINNVNVTTNGQVVRMGEPLAEMIADGDKLVIEIGINPKDIAFVSIGQEAKVNFTSYDPSVYGSFDGLVMKVSPTTKKMTDDSPAMYVARIEVVDDKKLNKINIQSGMIVDASIIGEERSVISYVFSPITKLSQKAFRE